jgi:hypothetical protein
MVALQMLKDDHNKVKRMLVDGESTTARGEKTRRELFARLKGELEIHEAIEERIFYPALKEHHKAKEIVLEGFEEHHVVDTIMGQLQRTPVSDEQWAAKFTVMKENVEHHIEEEEGEMFKNARPHFSREELDASWASGWRPSSAICRQGQPLELDEPGCPTRRGRKPLAPRRAGHCKVVSSRRPRGDDSHTESPVDGSHGLAVEARQAAARIARRGRHDHAQRAPRPQQPDEASRHRRRLADGGGQQRSPREMDRDQVCVLAQLGGKGLEPGDDEASVGHAPARCGMGSSPGDPHHCRAARVDADHELAGMSRCASQHRPPVAGTQVQCHRHVGGGGLGQLTDVDLAETMTDLNLHRQMIIRQ